MSRAMGFLIGVFYIMVVLFAVSFLATGQFRSASGSSYDTWRFNYDSNRYLSKMENERLGRLRNELVSNGDAQNFTDKCLNMYDASGNLNMAIEKETLDELKAARAARKDYNTLPFNLSRCIYRGPVMLRFDKDYYTSRIDGLIQDIENAHKTLGSIEEQHKDLVKGHQEFLAFKEMEKKWYTKVLVAIPYDLLVMLLVMSMGLLGGIIRILRDFGSIERTDPALKEYFFIPLTGAVVAIGGYILAKTGLLLLASDKGETSLSPFMIGLVGIISGLLAKEVIDCIAVAGRKILKGKKDGETDTPVKS